MVNVKIKSRYENTKSGYIKLYLENGKVVDEHRYIMSNHLGRELDSNETVHHKDEDKKNNEIQNLEIISPSKHAYNHNIGTAKYITIKCSHCNENFSKLLREYKCKTKKGQIDFYCNRTCMASDFGRGRDK